MLLPAVALYLIIPLGIVPDFIPGLGQLDDALVVLLAIGVFLRSIPPGVTREHIDRWRAEHASTP
jgi:uncharacterized membrane protein YkvA (DUF1232 family)